MHKIVVFILLNFAQALGDVIFCVLFVLVPTQCECIMLLFLSCYVLHLFTQQQQQQLELPSPSFICRNSNDNSSKKNYNVEGGAATYSYNPGKKKQEERERERKEKKKEPRSTCSFNAKPLSNTIAQHIHVCHIHACIELPRPLPSSFNLVEVQAKPTTLARH
jgi:hypothetical protein